MKIRISDIFCDRKIRTRATVVQQRTGRRAQFELMTDARASLLKWLELRGGLLEDFAFPSCTDHAAHISTRQYARLVDEWVTGIGLPGEDYGTHSLRPSKTLARGCRTDRRTCQSIAVDGLPARAVPGSSCKTAPPAPSSAHPSSACLRPAGTVNQTTQATSSQSFPTPSAHPGHSRGRPCIVPGQCRCDAGIAFNTCTGTTGRSCGPVRGSHRPAHNNRRTGCVRPRR